MGHVGNGHEDSWDAADRAPRELKREATAADPEASRKVARVKYYLSRHGVPEAAVCVYYDHGYDSVQIDRDRGMDDSEWAAFRRAIWPDGVRYVGGTRSYCTDEFVNDLPDPPEDGECIVSECYRDGPHVAPIIDNGEVVTLCRYHRKVYWGVSS
jgi:hypothetical protein